MNTEYSKYKVLIQFPHNYLAPMSLCPESIYTSGHTPTATLEGEDYFLNLGPKPAELPLAKAEKLTQLALEHVRKVNQNNKPSDFAGRVVDGSGIVMTTYGDWKVSKV